MTRPHHIFYTYFFLALHLLSVVSAQDDGWHLDTIYELINERLDPIVSPNGVAGHMHKVIGGSRFGAAYNYDDYSSAHCSSVKVQADKSNYWMPGERSQAFFFAIIG